MLAMMGFHMNSHYFIEETYISHVFKQFVVTFPPARVIGVVHAFFFRGFPRFLNQKLRAASPPARPGPASPRSRRPPRWCRTRARKHSALERKRIAPWSACACSAAAARSCNALDLPLFHADGGRVPRGCESLKFRQKSREKP